MKRWKTRRIIFCLSLLFIISLGCNSFSPVATSSPSSVIKPNESSARLVSLTPSSTISPSFTPILALSPSPSFSQTSSATSTKCAPKEISVPSTPTPAPNNNVPPLTVQMLKNGTYTMPEGEIVTLKNGWYEDYERNAEGEIVSYYWVKMGKTAFGDLNGDGIADAAVELAERGGSSWFISIHVILNQNGTPKQSGYHWTDYAAFPKYMFIDRGQIALGGIGYGDDDPNCCPTLPTLEVLQYLSEGNIILRRFTSDPNGQHRELDIVRPVEGTKVSCSVRVVGTITYMPEPLVVVFRVRDVKFNQLFIGELNVTATETGGVFEGEVDVSFIPPGTLVFLEISDFASRYNTVQALESVVLQVS